MARTRMETPMFDQTMKTAADAYFGQMKKAFDGLSATPGKLDVAPAIREFATRQTETARARLAEAQKASLDAANGLETAAVAAAGFGAGLVRSAVEGAVANTTMVIDAARDIAAAASPPSVTASPPTRTRATRATASP